MNLLKKIQIILCLLFIYSSLTAQSANLVDGIKMFNGIRLQEDFRYYDLAYDKTVQETGRILKQYKSKGSVVSKVSVTKDNKIVAIVTKTPATRGEGVAYVNEFEKELGNLYIVEDGYKIWQGREVIFMVKYNFDTREIETMLADAKLAYKENRNLSKKNISTKEVKLRLIPYFKNYLDYRLSLKKKSLGYCPDGHFSYTLKIISIEDLDIVENEIIVKGNYYFNYNFSSNMLSSSNCFLNNRFTQTWNEDLKTEFTGKFKAIGDDFEVIELANGNRLGLFSDIYPLMKLGY